MLLECLMAYMFNNAVNCQDSKIFQCNIVAIIAVYYFQYRPTLTHTKNTITKEAMAILVICFYSENCYLDKPTIIASYLPTILCNNYHYQQKCNMRTQLASFITKLHPHNHHQNFHGYIIIVLVITYNFQYAQNAPIYVVCACVYIVDECACMCVKIFTQSLRH